MSGVIVQLALGNVAASAALAGVAWLVHRSGRYPSLAHLLWVLSLVKLITPPLLLLPLIQAESAPSGATSSTPATTWLAHEGVALLLAVWALGSVVVLALSMFRIVRFDSLLRSSTAPASAGIQATAQEAAGRLGLRKVPTVYLASDRIAPMTWWAGGRVWVVLPGDLPQAITPPELRWVIAHELAHVKRRDHLVRWIEWLTCVTFWWNPVSWWARRNLRHDEEASCDALVLERLGAQPRAYAGALLAVVEMLAGPTSRPPAVATGIDGGSLERRFSRILATDRVARAPRILALGALSMAAVIMSLGIGGATGTPEPSGSTGSAGVIGSTPGVAVTSDAGADEYRPVAYVAERSGAAGNRAERELKAARRALAKADRAVANVDVAPAKAARKVKEARAAVHQATRAVERLDPSARGMEQALRSIKRDLREVVRALKAAGTPR